MRVLHRGSVDSTQDEARRLFATHGHGNFAVIAESQTKGRGRQGRAWTSQHDGLFATIALEVDLPADQAWRWSILFALAIQESLKLVTESRISPWIKWPNDLLVGTKKVAGILCETEIRGDRVESMLLGVGVNLAPPEGGWAGPLAQSATSLEELGVALVRDTLVAEVLHQVQIEDAHLQTGRFPERLRAWMALGNPLVGTEVNVEARGSLVRARVTGFGEDGALQIDTEDGPSRIFAGDVHLLSA